MCGFQRLGGPKYRVDSLKIHRLRFQKRSAKTRSEAECSNALLDLVSWLTIVTDVSPDSFPPFKMIPPAPFKNIAYIE